MQRGLCGTQVCIGLTLAVHAFIELAFGDRLLAPQALRALLLTPGLRTLGLGCSNLRFSALHICSVGGRVNRQQQVALFDKCAFTKVHGLYGAGDTRADVHTLDSFEAAREFIPGCNVTLHHSGDGHRRGGCFCNCRLCARAAHTKDGGGDSGECQHGDGNGQQAAFGGMEANGLHDGRVPGKLKN